MKKARILVPVVTAFHEDGQIDVEANKHIYDHLIQGGVDGIVLLGSIGEFYSMSMNQQKALIDFALPYINQRVTVYVGTSCMTIEDTIEMSNYAKDAGADAVMIITPYYFVLSDDSLEFFYNQVAKATSAKIYLYNFPARTGYNIPHHVALNVTRANDNIIGYKDSVSEMGHTRKLITTMLPEFPEFDVLSGFDENLAHNFLCGGGGCIGGLSNVAPELFAGWVKAINEENFEQIALHQKRVDKLMNIYEIGLPFMPAMKKAMILRGIQMEDHCIAPILPVTDVQTRQIKELLVSVGLI